jgi:tetratricopeptide (TPR) repeat protein
MLWSPVNRLRALEFAERAAGFARQIGDKPILARDLIMIGGILIVLGRYPEAKTTLDQALAILSGSDHNKSLFNVLINLGAVAILTNDLAAAKNHFFAAGNLADELADPLRENLVLVNLAEIYYLQRVIELAIKRARQAARGFRAAGLSTNLGEVLVNLASYLAIQGEYDEARALALEALELLKDIGGYFVRAGLKLLALLAALDGRPDEAAVIRGHVVADTAASGEPWQPLEQETNDLLDTALAGKFTPAALADLTEDGAHWPQKRAVNFALALFGSTEPEPV